MLDCIHRQDCGEICIIRWFCPLLIAPRGGTDASLRHLCAVSAHRSSWSGLPISVCMSLAFIPYAVLPACGGFRVCFWMRPARQCHYLLSWHCFNHDSTIPLWAAFHPTPPVFVEPWLRVAPHRLHFPCTRPVRWQHSPLCNPSNYWSPACTDACLRCMLRVMKQQWPWGAWCFYDTEHSKWNVGWSARQTAEVLWFTCNPSRDLTHWQWACTQGCREARYEYLWVMMCCRGGAQIIPDSDNMSTVLDYKLRRDCLVVWLSECFAGLISVCHQELHGASSTLLPACNWFKRNQRLSGQFYMVMHLTTCVQFYLSCP